MKKAVSIMLFFALFLLLAGCKEVPVSESSEPLNSNNVIKWFDCLNGDESKRKIAEYLSPCGKIGVKRQGAERS